MIKPLLIKLINKTLNRFRPTPTSKGKPLSQHLGVDPEAGAILPEEEKGAAENVNTGSGTPDQQLAPNTATVQSDSRDDCASSVTSGSSGFESLTKKRPPLLTSGIYFTIGIILTFLDQFLTEYRFQNYSITKVKLI